MGNVAVAAGYYLMAKLEMHQFAEFSAHDLFEVEFIDVKDGLVRSERLPRSRLFVWRDPQEQRDIIVFLGEAQPPSGKYAFCRKLVEFAKSLGVERVLTFAAMATDMPLQQRSRVFAAASDARILAELKQLELEILVEGRIGGLNGVLLGVAAECGMESACLLGEMPSGFIQLPFPKASLAVLNVFTTMTGIEVDVEELDEQARATEHRLAELLERMKIAMREQLSQQGQGGEEEVEFGVEPEEEPGHEDNERLEQLFEQAKRDRSKAYELKRELDRLGVFKEYQDRFLDLFKKPE